MRTRRALPGLRVVIAFGTLAVVGFCAGAAMPDSASADGSNGGGNQNFCYPADPNAAAPKNEMVGSTWVQTCTIAAAAGVCIQRSSEAVVSQLCTFTQGSPLEQSKRATAIQIHNPEGLDGTQDGTQVITAMQSNTNRNNVLDAVQIADQCLGAGDRYEGRNGDRYDRDRDGDRDDDGRCEDEDEEDNDDEERAEDRSGLSLLSTITQDQEAHQSIDGTQTATGTGRNESTAFQGQHLHQRAANAPAIFQSQNVDDRGDDCSSSLVFEASNACYTIDQNAANGANISRLLQAYNLFQSARNTDAGLQAQGSFEPFFGGLSHGFDQSNTGTNVPAGKPIQSSSQNERMTQRRDDTGSMTWHQHGPLRKDVGLQTGGNGGTANIRQDSVLSSTGGGVGEQTDLLEIECGSVGGNCTGFQRAKTNDEVKTNGPFTAPFISMTINCGGVSPPDYYVITENGACVASATEPD